MDIAYVQSASASTYKRGWGGTGYVRLRATFGNPTSPGNFVVAVIVASGGRSIDYELSDSGFIPLFDRSIGDLQLVILSKENVDSFTSVTMFGDAYRGVTFRIFEYSGVRTAFAGDTGSLDARYSTAAFSGSTPATTQSDELLFGIVANQYLSSQSAFSGGLTKLFEDKVPDGDTDDWERARVTFHQSIVSATGSYSLGATLGTARRWHAALLTFKGGSTGPARLYSRYQPSLFTAAGNGGSKLIVFGRLVTSTDAVYNPGVGVRARIGPFGDQFRLGGWSGLTIGQGTDYAVESIDGLEGWEARTSDDDLPRDDGALRGVDVQTARNIVMKLNYTGSREDLEARKVELMRWLVLQRSEDWELLFRLPGEALKSIYVRPTSMLRNIDPGQVFLQSQSVVLRAADPRHYAASTTTIEVPITSSRSSPNLMVAVNMGTGPAYPVIRITGPPTGAATRVTLTNVTSHDVFDVSASLGPGNELIADMRSRVAGAAVSPVTIDGVSKYGSWQAPRIPFALAPGTNYLMFEVEPVGTAVTCTIEYRSTWAG